MVKIAVAKVTVVLVVVMAALMTALVVGSNHGGCGSMRRNHRAL